MFLIQKKRSLIKKKLKRNATRKSKINKFIKKGGRPEITIKVNNRAVTKKSFLDTLDIKINPTDTYFNMKEKISEMSVEKFDPRELRLTLIFEREKEHKIIVLKDSDIISEVDLDTSSRFPGRPKISLLSNRIYFTDMNTYGFPVNVILAMDRQFNIETDYFIIRVTHFDTVQVLLSEISNRTGIQMERLLAVYQNQPITRYHHISSLTDRCELHPVFYVTESEYQWYEPGIEQPRILSILNNTRLMVAKRSDLRHINPDYGEIIPFMMSTGIETLKQKQKKNKMLSSLDRDPRLDDGCSSDEDMPEKMRMAIRPRLQQQSDDESD